MSRYVPLPGRTPLAASRHRRCGLVCCSWSCLLLGFGSPTTGLRCGSATDEHVARQRNSNAKTQENCPLGKFSLSFLTNFVDAIATRSAVEPQNRSPLWVSIHEGMHEHADHRPSLSCRAARTAYLPCHCRRDGTASIGWVGSSMHGVAGVGDGFDVGRVRRGRWRIFRQPRRVRIIPSRTSRQPRRVQR